VVGWERNLNNNTYGDRGKKKRKKPGAKRQQGIPINTGENLAIVCTTPTDDKNPDHD